MPFGRRMFRVRRPRFRRRRKRLNFVIAKKNTCVINIAIRSLAANTTETHTLLIADDTPSPLVVSTGSGGTIAECEEGSRYFCKKLKMSFTSAVSDPVGVAFLLWKDGPYGTITDPTSAEDVVAVTAGTGVAMLKKHAAMYRKFWLSPNSDTKTFFLKVPKRLSMLRHGESLKLTVTNLEAATDAIEYFVQGRIVTIG